MIKSLNRPDITKRFAKDLGLTYKQVDDILEQAEKELSRYLREREQVRIHGFGTFYVTTMKSHVIKQIRTKTPRIILEQKSVRFRTSPVFKDEIYERSHKKQTSRPKAEKILEHKEQPKVKIVQITKESEPKKEPEKPKPTIVFNPVTIHPRVEKETIRKKIIDRWLSVARSSKDQEKPSQEIARETMIVGSLLSQIKKAGYASVSFSYTSDKYVNLFGGKPRRQLSHLSKQVMEGFLDYIDLKEFHIPQERRLILTLNKARNERINLDIHSFPTDAGASIIINIG